MHLDKEIRDADFKNNLDQKMAIIEKAKALLSETDLTKAFRELQVLHKVWKEEIGPVDKEHREKIWQEFSEVTKQMHDKREAMLAQTKEKNKTTLLQKQCNCTTYGFSNRKSCCTWRLAKTNCKMEALRQNFCHWARSC